MRRLKPGFWILLLVVIAILVLTGTCQKVIKLAKAILPGENPVTTPVPVQPTQVPVAQATPVKPTVSSTKTTAVPPTTVPQPTAVTQKETLTVAFDSFGSYFTVAQIDQMARQYDLKLIPFNFNIKEKPANGTEWSAEEKLQYNIYTEDERAAKLKNGEWDVLLTTLDSLSRKGNIGYVVAVIDQSAGADKIVAYPRAANGHPLNIFNDIEGSTVAFSEGSVGQYQLLATLRLVGISADKITMKGQPSVADAVQYFIDRKADVVAGWEPDINNTLTPDVGGREWVSSAWWRNISDVIVISPNANASKREAVKTFLHDWFQSLKAQQEDYDGKLGGYKTVSGIIANWQFNGESTSDWTYVYPGSEVNDLNSWLGTIAQAGLGANKTLMENPSMLADNLTAARDVWSWGGAISQDQPFDPLSMIEPNYVLELAQERDLYPSKGQFINPTFQPVPAELPSLDAKALINVPSIAELPCKQFDYDPNSAVLKEASFRVLEQCAKPMLQMIRTSDAYVLVTGYSAWPKGYSQTQIENFATSRALSVYTALVDRLHVDPNRIKWYFVIPPPQDQNAENEAQMAPYRKVVVEIKRGGR